MRISSIPQIYRHGYRSTEIFTVLSRYGLADWLGRVGLGPKSTGGATIAHSPWETRVRMALAELGPTFIKLGQVLSTRPDLVGVRLADELKHLQADVPGDSAEQVRKTIELELGRPVSDLFAEFDGEPMASASIGQVHRARLKTGEAVVVKVQHADIQRKIEVDLDILGGLAMLAEMNADLQNYRPRAIAAEFHRTLMRELDFGREQRQMLQFSRDFSGNPCVHIPRPYPELSTSRVLTMELIEGIKLEEHERLAEEGFDLSELARTGARLYLDMIFGNGFAVTTGVLTKDPETGQMVLPDMPEDIGIFDAVQMGDPINGNNWFNLIVLIVIGQAAAWTLVQIGSVWLEPVLSAGILLLSPVTSVIVAWPLFGEIPSLLQWLGILIILGCVAFQNGLFDAVFKKKAVDTAQANEDVAV